MRILRSMLFVPGNNMRFIHRSVTLPADAVILDLEDSCPVQEKPMARIFIKDSLDLLGSVGFELWVRPNGTTTGLLEADLDGVVRKGLNGILLPKVEDPNEVKMLGRMLTERERERGIPRGSVAIIPTIESAKGSLNVLGICAASKRNVGIGFGAGDYLRDFGRSAVEMSKDGTEVIYTRSRIAIAARVTGILAIDTVFFGLITDEEGLRRESRLALQLGFNGKFLIHPNQIEPVNEVFSPTPRDVDHARRVMEAAGEAKKRGLGATTLDGRLIDIAFIKLAENTLAVADAISTKQGRGNEPVPADKLTRFS